LEGADQGSSEMLDTAQGVMADGVAFEVFDEPQGSIGFVFFGKQRQFKFQETFSDKIIFPIKPFPCPNQLLLFSLFGLPFLEP